MANMNQELATLRFPAPGSVVHVFVGPFKHPGIVTDRIWNGAPMVVSNSLRSGGTYEEPWTLFAGRRTVYVGGGPGHLPAWQVVQNARALVGRRWNLFSFNCEHFLTAALGLKPHSPQLQAAGFIAAVGAVVIFAGGRGR